MSKNTGGSFLIKSIFLLSFTDVTSPISQGYSNVYRTIELLSSNFTFTVVNAFIRFTTLVNKLF